MFGRGESLKYEFWLLHSDCSTSSAAVILQHSSVGIDRIQFANKSNSATHIAGLVCLCGQLTSLQPNRMTVDVDWPWDSAASPRRKQDYRPSSFVLFGRCGEAIYSASPLCEGLLHVNA